MKKSELETMRKSFDTVKSRSNSIKDSESTKRLTKRVQEIKKYSFENKDELFNQVIDSFKRNGIEVEFAKTSQDALDIIDGLIDEYDAEVIAKAKSNTLGEIDLKNHLDIDVVETDLGDRILQLKKTDNKPVHPTGPASHLNIEDITGIVNESLDVNVNPDAQEIMRAVRADVLKRLENASMLKVRSVEHEGRLRKYYHITKQGLARLEEFKEDWKEILSIYNYITREDSSHE